MAHGLLGIDRIRIAVEAIDTAPMLWTRLGFTLGPRGRELGRGVAGYDVAFARGGLELRGVVDPAAADGDLVRFLDGGDGAMALVLETGDLDATAASLDAAGLAHAAPVEVARQVELETDSVLLRARRMALDGAASPGLACLIGEARPRDPAWLDHPNGAKGLRGVTLMLNDPPAAAAEYERLFGPAAVNRTDDIVTIHIGPHRLMLAGPSDIEALYPELELELPADCDPSIVLITLGVADLDATADYLTQWRIEHEQRGRHSLFVPGYLAHGTALEFIAD